MDWEKFKKSFPGADLTKFKEVNGDIIYKPTGEVLYRKGDLQTETLKHIVAPPPPFPEAYVETILTYPMYDPKPENGFSKSVTKLEIPVGQGSFTITMRDIFKDATITHNSGKESRAWLAGPDIKYWPQQLNFAVWAATKGCGIAMDMFNTAFLRFHVAFTMRRVLKELNVPLPGDTAFNQKDNHYSKVAWERLKNEFKLRNPDFRNKEGTARGLGETYVWSGGPWIQRQGMGYPSEWEFADLGGKADQGNLIYFIKSQDKTPWAPFIAAKGVGLKNLARINRSIEAFVYCILGAQVNTRSPIVAAHGASQETQQEFLTLFESAVIENDISKSVQRYQLAVQQSKVRLDYAISPGCWLMPSNLVINTHAVVGYNNKLQRATTDMKFGVNDINSETTKGMPHVDTKKTHIDLPRLVSKDPKRPPKKVVKLPTMPVYSEEKYDHTLLKAGIAAGAVAMSYYIWT